MSATEYQEDLHAELGYRTAGRRELAQREWYSLRGEANEVAPNPNAFDALVNRLRLRRGDDGVPGRSHRLRLLGNSCVAQQAALAWVKLSARAAANLRGSAEAAA